MYRAMVELGRRTHIEKIGSFRSERAIPEGDLHGSVRIVADGKRLLTRGTVELRGCRVEGRHAGRASRLDSKGRYFGQGSGHRDRIRGAFRQDGGLTLIDGGIRSLAFGRGRRGRASRATGQDD